MGSCVRLMDAAVRGVTGQGGAPPQVRVGLHHRSGWGSTTGQGGAPPQVRVGAQHRSGWGPAQVVIYKYNGLVEDVGPGGHTCEWMSARSLPMPPVPPPKGPPLTPPHLANPPPPPPPSPYPPRAPHLHPTHPIPPEPPTHRIGGKVLHHRPSVSKMHRRPRGCPRHRCGRSGAVARQGVPAVATHPRVAIAIAVPPPYPLRMRRAIRVCRHVLRSIGVRRVRRGVVILVVIGLDVVMLAAVAAHQGGGGDGVGMRARVRVRVGHAAAAAGRQGDGPHRGKQLADEHVFSLGVLDLGGQGVRVQDSGLLGLRLVARGLGSGFMISAQVFRFGLRVWGSDSG